MSNFLYIDNLEIPFLHRKGTCFLINKSFLKFFESTDIGNEIYFSESGLFKKIQFKSVKKFSDVARFEWCIEVQLLESITLPVDMSDWREFQLQRILDDEKKVSKKVNFHKLFIHKEYNNYYENNNFQK